MAKQVIEQIIDDIDGAVLVDYETVRWGLDGKAYEFDASPENVAMFRSLMAEYVAVSRRERFSF